MLKAFEKIKNFLAQVRIATCYRPMHFEERVIEQTEILQGLVFEIKYFSSMYEEWFPGKDSSSFKSAAEEVTFALMHLKQGLKSFKEGENEYETRDHQVTRGSVPGDFTGRLQK